MKSKKATKVSPTILGDLFDEKFDHKLTATTPVKNFHEPLKTELKSLYKSNDLNSTLLACLINGIYTSGITRFLFSVRLLEALIQADFRSKNLKRKSLNNVEFSTFKAFLIKRKIIEQETEPTPYSKGIKGGKAAFCLLIEPRILKLLDSDLENKSHKVAKNLIPNISMDDDTSPEQHEYEDKLAISQLDSEFQKMIGNKSRNKTKPSTKAAPTPPVTEEIDFNELSHLNDPELIALLKELDNG